MKGKKTMAKNKELSSITDTFYQNTGKGKRTPSYTKCTLGIDNELIPWWHEMAYQARMGKSEYINHLIRAARDEFVKTGGALPE